MKVIFTLPQSLQAPGRKVAAPVQWPKTPLAYVEWFSRQSTTANKTHGMFQISRAYDSAGRPQGAVIPITNIRQNCMLFPLFPKTPKGNTSIQSLADWCSDNTLDKAKVFLINNFLNKYAYQTLW